MFQRLDHLVLSPYATDIVIGLMATSAVFASVLLTPSPEAVALFGFTLPGACAFKGMTGIGCFGCGLTRSFAYMGELAVFDAFRMNLMGPPSVCVGRFSNSISFILLYCASTADGCGKGRVDDG